MNDQDIPLVYRDGYDRAVTINPDLATNYIQYTTVGDPLADAVVEALAPLTGQEINRIMSASLDRGTETDPNTLPVLNDLIGTLGKVPTWFDHDAVLPGRLALYRHLDLFITGLIFVSLQNFNSLMSKVFFLTGQGTTQQGLRVIRQNIRYLTETLMLPHSLDPWEEGWKFSIRVRLVHARFRRHLCKSGAWNKARLGEPISAANMALTSANFSATLIRNVQKLGANLDADERAGLMQVWRYASWLMGTPDSLLCGGDEDATAELSRIGHLCEPVPDGVTMVITKASMGVLPEVARLTDPAKKQAMVEHGYRLARALLGNELVEQYGFPRKRTFGLLPLMRLRYRLQNAPIPLAPAIARCWNDDPFLQLLDAARIASLRRQMPDELRAARVRTNARKRS